MNSVRLLLIILFISGCTVSRPVIELSNTSLSGDYFENQIWSEKIVITGDVLIHGDLLIRPDTIICFSVGDDTQSGQEIKADGFNDNDPTRLSGYTQSHSEIGIKGKLTAIGENHNIIFTSIAENPKLADWIGIRIEGDGSIMEDCVVEWSRNGIVIKGKQSDTRIKNNIINNTFWGGIHVDGSSPKLYNNYINEAGHEGIDIQSGNPDIRHNHIRNARTGIVVLGGTPSIINNTMYDVGQGIHHAEGIVSDAGHNKFSLITDRHKNWTYGTFSYFLYAG
ncbi:right-handed parallel beta-helix repeat-containing protein [Candidatus Woesearchaeota archaeon]|nr:right-handed parallel beta-helix repeat-containing protein [Candidatus Woesearchaeota archaeon]